MKVFLLWKVGDLICPLPGVDPGRVDWPPLEQATKKIKCMEKQRKYVGSQKPSEANQPCNVKTRKRDQTIESGNDS